MPFHAFCPSLLSVVPLLACTVVTLPHVDDGGSESATCDTLAPRAFEVLTEHCGSCHGAGSPGLGGIRDILDVDALVAAGKLVLGDPESSRIYARMNDAEAPMPPKGESKRPADDDLQAIRAWIGACGAEEACDGRPFISRDEVLRRIGDDLEEVGDNPTALPFTRYFSLVHLQNAGLCDAQIEPYRQALSKLANSLSRGVDIAAPVALDPERLLFRIDLRKYRWEAQGEVLRLSEPTFYFDDPRELESTFVDRWELLAGQLPYTVEYIGSVAEQIKKDTGTAFFVLRGDAFVDAAARSPLYYDLLEIPRCSTRFRKEGQSCAPGDPCCEDRLERQLGVNILEDILGEVFLDNEIVARAGLYTSGVSKNNRVLERHTLPSRDGALWITYDFANSDEAANIQSHPLDFVFNGGEIIFTLPNGLQGYMLTDARGTRLNEAPTEIVQDPSQRDVVVRNGVSCMGCHEEGMLTGRDEIRSGLCEEQLAFGEDTCDVIKRIYPGQAEIDNLLDRDEARFKAALERAGVHLAAEDEPVRATFLAFDQDLDTRRAAAEFELPEDQLLRELARLSPDLYSLRDQPGSVRREVFTKAFAASVCLLRIGRTRCCPDSFETLTPECASAT